MKRIYCIIVPLLLTFGCMTKNGVSLTELSLVDTTFYTLGEGSIWDAPNERLFFVDIIGKKLFEYYPVTGRKLEYDMPSMIGTIVIKDDQHVLVALEDGIYEYNLQNKKLDFLVCPPENDSTQRFNDGKCDPAGRFWVGTMSLDGSKRSSHLFCMDTAGNIEVKLDGVTVSNGIVWSSDKQYMYYIDTPSRKIMEYKFNNETGELGESRVAVQVADSLGAPDGMSIDAEDRLWVCMWGGSAVCCFDSQSGEVLERIKIPAKNVTSCAFAGKDLRDLYITTARDGTSETELLKYPNAGGLFKITLKYAGKASNRY